MNTGDLDTRIDSLYQSPLDGFVEARTALAADLRAAGRRDLAAQVKALSKPSVTAWAVNQAWWHARPLFERMVEAGKRLLTVQQASLGGKAVNLREAVESRQEAVNAVVEQAVREMGGPEQVGPAMRQRIAGTCDALATGELPPGVTLGRLTADLQPAGFGAFAALMPSVSAEPRDARWARPSTSDHGTADRSAGQRDPGRAKASAEPDSMSAAKASTSDKATVDSPAERHGKVRDLAVERQRAEARTRARQAIGEAERALDEAARHARERRAAAEAASRDSEAAQARLLALERELDAARRDESSARAAARDAARAASAAEDARERAARDVEKARAALDRI